MANPRQLAFQTLRGVLRDQSYSNLSIAGALRSNDLSGADKSLYTSLVYGVLERKVTLDYVLSRYLKQPLRKLDPKVYTALLLGAYQVLFLDRVPDHAAINETVKLVKKNGAAYSAGLCNAVLRKVSEGGIILPELVEEPAEDSRSLSDEQARYYSVKYAVPEPLLNLWVSSYGLAAAEGILADALGPRPLTVRVNTTKTSAEELIARLSEEGVSAEPHGKVENALVLKETGSLSDLPSFREGLFHVQDAASQLCCQNLDVRPGQVVFDLCAAPGGKSCTIAEYLENSGTVKAFDLHEHRVELIKENAARLGLSCVEAAVGDATVFDPENGLADRVLCDVPCAGYGDIGRKPEIRFRAPEFVDDLPPLQYNILNNAVRYLRAGGRLVYSTCSLNPAENEAVVERFLKEHPDCTLLFRKTYFPQEYQCDGFFNAVIEKAGET